NQVTIRMNGLLFVIVLSAISVKAIIGCSCAFQHYANEQEEQAAFVRDFNTTPYVFIGTVTSVTQKPLVQTPGVISFNMNPKIVHFKIEQNFKKNQQDLKEITVKTASQDSMCGVGASVGERMQVWAYGTGDTISISLCTRTTRWADQDINRLQNLLNGTS
ncbi:unnamed protein product, partial [Didymodactylos carnosus]